MYIPDIKT